MSRRSSVTADSIVPPCLSSRRSSTVDHCNCSLKGTDDHTLAPTSVLSSPASLNSNVSSTVSLSSVTSQDRKKKLPDNSFYKRTLPATCVPFNSPKGRSLFTVGLSEGYMETYFALSLQFLTQAEPAYCGLSTLCMVLNALEVDPGRQWRGSVWRWYDETMLDCCRPLEEVMKDGITLSEFVCLARCNGLKALMRRADKTTKEQFLEDIKRTSREPKEFLVVSYNRGTLQQTGTGHFSPIGGYNEKDNMVLILDVARFKYPAYWISFDLMWESLQPIDKATGKPRGYVILKRGARSYIQSALSQLAVNRESWPRLSNILFKQLPRQFASAPPASPAQFIDVVVQAIPDEYDSVVENRMPLFVTGPDYQSANISDGQDPMSGQDGQQQPQATRNAHEIVDAYIAGLDDLLHKLSETDLYKLVADSIAAKRKRKAREEMMALAAAASAKVAAALATASESSSNAVAQQPEPPSASAQPPSLQRLSSLNSARISSPPMSPRFMATHPVTGAMLHSSRTSLYGPSGFFTPEGATSSSFSLSLADLHPVNHPVNDFTAFLTMFLFALFSYKPFHEELGDVDADGDYGQVARSDGGNTSSSAAGISPRHRRMSMAERVNQVVNPDVAGIEDPALRAEIAFLRNQIAALTELQDQEVNKSSNQADVASAAGTACCGT